MKHNYLIKFFLQIGIVKTALGGLTTLHLVAHFRKHTSARNSKNG